MQGKFIDLTGKKFGKLTVIKPLEERKHGHVQWKCRCDCGNEAKVRSSSLINNRTKSCGCILKQKVLNTYNLSGEYGIGLTSKGDEFYFDLEDYELIKDYTWVKDSYGYFVTTVKTPNGQYGLRLHRLIMGVVDAGRDVEIDHIYHKKYDNRKSQLRICNRTQNIHNRHIFNNNKSGTTGVSWDKNSKKWTARIKTKDKIVFLGNFDDKDEAINARKVAEKKCFGEFICKTVRVEGFDE